MNGLDLFSGIGGISVALSEWVRPIAYCEIDRYCQAVLLSRMADRSIALAPLWDDIRTFPYQQFTQLINIIYGGFPCQDISVAGHGKGLAGERSGLYWEIHRLAKEIQPSFIFLENVPAICTRGGWEVVSSLAEIGYDCRWTTLPACAVGAPHKRERWWLLAYSQHARPSSTPIRRSTEASISDSQKGKDLSKQFEGMDRSRNVAMQSFANSQSVSYKQNDKKSLQVSNREEARNQFEREIDRVGYKSYWQEIESPFCGVDDGVPHRAHRIRSLGNAVVPQCAKKAFKILMGLND